MTNYWTYVAFNQEELEELVEGDHELPYDVWERLEKHLASVREHFASIERQATEITRTAWNEQMEKLLSDDPFDPR